jgi:integrase
MRQDEAGKGMPKRPDFEPIETPDGWCVNVPASMSAKGRRERRFFADRKAAERFGGSMRRKFAEGHRGALLPADVAMQAAEAFRLLEPLGVSILDAAKQAAERVRLAATNETFGERYLRVMVEREGGWSTRYRADMAKVPRWVGREVMEARVADLTPAALKAALVANGAGAATTVKARMQRVLSVMAGKEARQKRVREIEILTPKQAAAVLRACATPAERRAVALLLFAGIRPSAEDGEIVRLRWDAVGASEIYVSAEVAKTNTDRHIPITPRLARLLRGHPATGPVVPPRWKLAYQRSGRRPASMRRT